MCNMCDKRFTYASNLRRHKFIHSGQRKFICQTCSLTKHLLTHQICICMSSFIQAYVDISVSFVTRVLPTRAIYSNMSLFAIYSNMSLFAIYSNMSLFTMINVHIFVTHATRNSTKLEV